MTACDAVVAPVPPLVSANVPERVSVPLVVIGPPPNDKPVVPPLALTDVTEPAPVSDQYAAVPFVVRILPVLPD